MGTDSRSSRSGNLAWLDLEMTGLDTNADEIIEMAILVTDSRLETVAESKTWVFSCDERTLEGMDSWNKSTHGSSGLIDLVRGSSLTYDEGEREGLEFMREHVNERESPMCGNTICQDRRFLAKHMPRLEAYFHYRNLDVSSFKIACSMWLRDMPAMLGKGNAHRAMDDIRESIQELRVYKEFLFKQ